MPAALRRAARDGLAGEKLFIAARQSAWRGNQPIREQVVDAPDVKLPRSNMPVENLLAYRAVPGPPPAEGLRD